jgi:AcrR family transcriptional regulator
MKNGHEKRALKKEAHIKKTALALFNKYGVSKVSIDEIADHANVSKVTIYKYFQSKQGLYHEIVKMIYEENIEAIQQLMEKDLPFIKKLKHIIAVKENSQHYLKGDFLRELIKTDHDIENLLVKEYQSKTKELIFDFLDQGKSAGYIDLNISNEVIYLYMEIFKAGMKEKATEIKTGIFDNQTFENLVNLFFYGFIEKIH